MARKSGAQRILRHTLETNKQLKLTERNHVDQTKWGELRVFFLSFSLYVVARWGGRDPEANPADRQEPRQYYGDDKMD